MRFMMILIPKGYESATPDFRPRLEAMTMGEYNQSLQKAGVLLALDGLLPPSTGGARISRADGKATVTDGPFAEAKEVIGGYWIIQTHSREEAIEWAKRAPIASNEIIEVRQIDEMSDFPEDFKKRPKASSTGMS